MASTQELLSGQAPTPMTTYTKSGVDTAAADAAITAITRRISGTFPKCGGAGTVHLPIGHFANVIEVAPGLGIAITTDGVGSKAAIAHEFRQYDTIGIDCVAMNVNDLLCVGARPLSLVDYIAVEKIDTDMLDGIAIGLAEGAHESGISVSGGEIAQLPGIVSGFDLVGTAIGSIELDGIVTGTEVEPGDVVIGLASNGLHSNGFTHAYKVLLAPYPVMMREKWEFSELGGSVKDELLRPTAIYVREILALHNEAGVAAMAHITGDGLLNITRTAAEVGYVLDNLPEPQPIFWLIENMGCVPKAEMYSIYNMGVGFTVTVAKCEVDKALEVFRRYNRQAQVIGYVSGIDPARSVHLPQHGLIGRGKKFEKA